SDVYHQPLNNVVPEEQDFHADHDGYQRQHVRHGDCLCSHRSNLLNLTMSPDSNRRLGCRKFERRFRENYWKLTVEFSSRSLLTSLRHQTEPVFLCRAPDTGTLNLLTVPSPRFGYVPDSIG